MIENYPFKLKPLNYSYDALEPIISEETLHFHHDKHLKTYVENLNKAIEPYINLQNLTINNIIKQLEKIPKTAQTAVRNNSGGVYNHELYFSILTDQRNVTKPSKTLQASIERDFGGMEKMIEKLKSAAIGCFGSGWSYIVTDKNGILSICTTANQDVPDLYNFVPLLAVDVWEHAYYLDYQNRRADYFDEFIKLINWDVISKRYDDRYINF